MPKIVCAECYNILEGFDKLCRIASSAQKELLNMLSAAKVNGKESKSGKKRAARKTKTENDEQQIAKKRVRRKKSDSKNKDIVPETPQTNDVFGHLKLGQIIRDTELIKLILKALKWTEDDDSVEKLRNSDLATVLSNTNLLHDDDLIKLIKSYVGPDGNNNNHRGEGVGFNWTGVDNSNDLNFVTEMEVKVDPSLFLPEETEDDSRTISVDLEEIISNEKVRYLW